MKKLILLLPLVALFAASNAGAQENLQLENYDKVNFYGIDFAPVRVVGASETPEEFVHAFWEINNLFLSEPDKYITPLCTRLFGEEKTTSFRKAKAVRTSFDYIDIAAVLEATDDIEFKDLKHTGTVRPFTAQELEAELLGLGIEPAEGLGIVVIAGELNKGADYGTYYYVFFDNETLEVLSTSAYKGKSGGMGLRNYWARSFYNTIFEINPTRLYQTNKKIKAKVSEGVDSIKVKVSKPGKD